ncbi:MAG TPA: zinc dependent phospholipase C family protein [Gemmatimonadaceae bacterium]|nr:zinc dependent phospholipase C family protein [Gemmatimonadaceae bacterium]
MRPRALGLALVAAVFLLVLLPETAHAWTPGTHVHLGEALLRSLWLLPEGLRALLSSFPHDFLYGSIAADTSIAKKYAAAGRHSHSWQVGFEVLERARDDRLRAFAYGYLAHLAADTVAHNYFVPRQLATTASTTALGHSYWESRAEMYLGEAAPRRARELIMLDHSRSDAHLDAILSPTIFSIPTSRRIFRGMVRAADMESWQRVFQALAERSRWDLPEEIVASHLERSFDYVVDLLVRGRESEPLRLDPAGTAQLKWAKRLRRTALRGGGVTAAFVEAERHFGLPPSSLGYAAQVDPLLRPGVRQGGKALDERYTERRAAIN